MQVVCMLMPLHPEISSLVSFKSRLNPGCPGKEAVSTHGDICVNGFELFVPAAQMCHQHEQDQSESDADVEQMNTRAPQ